MSEEYKNTPVKFFYRDIKMNFKSKEAGKPIWETREFISIMKPGNSKDVSERKVKPLDIERWGTIYNAWKNREKQIQSGTRLEVLPGIEQNKLELCKSLNIYTIEQLVSVNEEGVANLGADARDLMLEGKRYLQGSTAANEMQKEVDEIKIENKALKKENQELKDRINDLINNDTECSERDTASTRADNGNRKRGRIHKASTVSTDKSGLGVVGTA